MHNNRPKHALAGPQARAWTVALAGCLAVLALQAAGAGGALEYRRAALSAQPWRLFSGHWVHVGWMHALLNCAAWLAVALLFGRELGARRQVWLLAASALAISAAFVLLEPGLQWYRGLSGVLHALFCAGAVLWIDSQDAARSGDETRSGGRRLAWALLAGAWLKVLAESAGGARFAPASWLDAPVVTRAHLYGAAAGTLLAAALAGLRRLSSAQPSRPASGC